MKKLAYVTIAVAASLATLACGDSNQVGNKKLLNFTPPPVVASPSPSPVQKAAPPPAPVVQKTVKPAPVVQTVTVDIVTNSPYFTPQNLKISHGTTVKFVNQDSQPDFVEVVNGAGTTVAKSPQIMPGGAWSYTFSTPGSYQLNDRRPYATDPVSVS